MSLYGQIDVVVIGFGAAGAAAAFAAAGAGARVLALDRKSALPERGWGASARARSRSALRAAAREAGVEVRPLRAAHELLMEADRVRGVGYATLPDGGTAATACRFLDAVSGSSSSGAARAVARCADRLRPSDFLVEEVGCVSVVLAMDPRHWDFVGPAVWTATKSTPDMPPTPTDRRGGLHLVGPDEPRFGPTPELRVRLWCAENGTRLTPGQRCELRTDGATGAVRVGDAAPVPGLYAAVPAGRSRNSERGWRTEPTMGMRAGRHAADMALQDAPSGQLVQAARALSVSGH
jgi:choline dehydrogenase-like flavoprotein